jgi:catechol 2,3-dioxygenase-like lactoylglutathione lyase family enzyme
MLGANDIEASRRFYDAVLGALGIAPAVPDPKGRLLYFGKSGIFAVTAPLDGQPATPANGGTIGFAVQSAEDADAWHRAGVAAGGTSCEDPPGWRENAVGKIYLAYLRDPAGNKLCASCRL